MFEPFSYNKVGSGNNFTTDQFNNILYIVQVLSPVKGKMKGTRLILLNVILYLLNSHTLIDMKLLIVFDDLTGPQKINELVSLMLTKAQIFSQHDGWKVTDSRGHYLDCLMPHFFKVNQCAAGSQIVHAGVV